MLPVALSSGDQLLMELKISFVVFSDHIYGLEREKEKLSEKVLAAEKALHESGSKK